SVNKIENYYMQSPVLSRCALVNGDLCYQMSVDFLGMMTNIIIKYTNHPNPGQAVERMEKPLPTVGLTNQLRKERGNEKYSRSAEK
ncbi:hypothetical protein, partial [Escherichia coli]